MNMSYYYEAGDQNTLWLSNGCEKQPARTIRRCQWSRRECIACGHSSSFLDDADYNENKYREEAWFKYRNAT